MWYIWWLNGRLCCARVAVVRWLSSFSPFLVVYCLRAGSVHCNVERAWLNCHGWQWQICWCCCALEGSSIAGLLRAKSYLPKTFHAQVFVCDWHVGSPVLGRNPLYRVSKWRTFVGKKPLLILSFRAVLLCVSRKILVYTAAHTRLQGKGLQGFTFFLFRHYKFSFFFHRAIEDETTWATTSKTDVRHFRLIILIINKLIF